LGKVAGSNLQPCEEKVGFFKPNQELNNIVSGR